MIFIAKKHQKILLLSLSIILIQFGSDAFWPEIAFAQNGNTPSESTFTTLTQLMSVLLTFLHFLTFLIFRPLAFLLQPKTFLDINQNGLLLRLWQLSRDVMNIIFVFILLSGGVIAIVRASSDAIKEHASRFILAVVLVNFSWFFPRVILDVSHVLTATVFGLSDLVAGQCIRHETVQNRDGTFREVQRECIAVVNFAFFNDPRRADPNGGWIEQLPDLLWIKKVRLDQVSGNPAFHLLSGLVINHSRLTELPFLEAQAGNLQNRGGPGDFRGLLEIIRLLIRVTLVLIIQIALFFPLFALLIAFLARIPILWLTVSFMPFIFLGFALNDKLGTDVTKKYIWEPFMKTAFLPFMVSIPLSVGYIMITAGMNSAPPPSLQELVDIQIPLLSGVSQMWGLFWLVLSLMVMWVGVFSVLKNAGSIYERIGSTVEGVGKGIGRAAAGVPLSLPIIPFGKLDNFDGKKDGKTSIADLVKFASQAGTTRGRFDNLGREGDPAEIRNRFANAPQGQRNDLKNFIDTLNGNNSPQVQELRRLNTAINNVLPRNLQGQTLTLEQFRQIAQAVGVDRNKTDGRQLADLLDRINQIRRAP